MTIKPQSVDRSNYFQILTIEEAAELLRLPVSTLRYWRHVSKGPKSGRVGGRVMYRMADIEAWLNEQFEHKR